MKIRKLSFNVVLIFIICMILVSCSSKTKETISSSENNEEVLISEKESVKKIYPSEQKVAFLTFDDGPSKNTEKILDILKEENAKATFFVIGNESNFAKSMYKRIIDEGHTIGNHTYSHSYKGVYKSQDEYIKDTEKLNEYIYSITGYRPGIIRFPGGSNNHVNRKYSGSEDNSFMEGLASKVEEEGYVYFDWTVDSTDASKVKQSIDNISSASISQALRQKYPIILFHDAPAKTTTVDALPKIIKELKRNGYLIDSLSKDSPVKSRFLKGDNGEILK